MCTIDILAEATTISMAKMPQLAVEEGTVAEYVCETDSLYPDQTAVLWFLDDKPVDKPDVQTEVNYSISVESHGNMTEYTLRLTTKREMNRITVKCVLQYNMTEFGKHNLEVMCRYLQLDIQQRYNLKCLP